MPELPEVETIVRELAESDLIGKKITACTVSWHRSVEGLTPGAFCQRIIGQKIHEIVRKGKHIVLTLDHDLLIIHLRMTGKFCFQTAVDPVLKHERIRLQFDDKKLLIFEDQRKFGKWKLVEKEKIKWDKVGLEPLSPDYTLEAFRKLILKRRTPAKAFLLNQAFLAGLGNIYVDEALWESKIHPRRSLLSLNDQEILRLFEAIPKVLEKGILHQGTTLGSSRANYFSVSGRRGGNQYQLNVFRREGQPCLRCGNEIIKIRVAQRGTHVCPHCQKIES